MFILIISKCEELCHTKNTVFDFFNCPFFEDFFGDFQGQLVTRIYVDVSKETEFLLSNR